MGFSIIFNVDFDKLLGRIEKWRQDSRLRKAQSDIDLFADSLRLIVAICSLYDELRIIVVESAGRILENREEHIKRIEAFTDKSDRLHTIIDCAGADPEEEGGEEVYGKLEKYKDKDRGVKDLIKFGREVLKAYKFESASTPWDIEVLRQYFMDLRKATTNEELYNVSIKYNKELEFQNKDIYPRISGPWIDLRDTILKRNEKIRPHFIELERELGIKY
jgi:hypothetical protein